MTSRHLIPLKKGQKRDTEVARRHEEWPVRSLSRDMDWLFDDLATGFIGGSPFMPALRFDRPFDFMPRVDVRDTGTELRIRAEIPGVDEKDLDVRLEGDVLVIEGEKKEEFEERRAAWYRTECTRGSFYREIPLPSEVHSEKAEATFRKGVLEVMLPKAKGKTEPVHRIHVKAA